MENAQITQLTQQLLQARATGVAVDWRQLAVADTAQAYAVQDATLAQLGPVAGWKVGSKGVGSEPSCAPLPASCVIASGALLDGPAWRRRALEVEVALRVGRDLGADEHADTAEALLQVFDAVLPAIEVVETRLSGQPCENPSAPLADLLSHGALVIGQPQPLGQALPDLLGITASLALDGQEVARMHGTNPAGDVQVLLSWLVRHTAARGTPLKKGQIVTTGTCTGVQHGQAGQQVQAEVEGVGKVALVFG